MGQRIEISFAGILPDDLRAEIVELLPSAILEEVTVERYDVRQTISDLTQISVKVGTVAGSLLTIKAAIMKLLNFHSPITITTPDNLRIEVSHQDQLDPALEAARKAVEITRGNGAHIRPADAEKPQ